jgi:hypothetical protein
MPRKKPAGVIEAVRYQDDGKIDTVRLFRRRGAVWSDRIIMTRSELLEHIAKGENYMTGQRQPYLGTWLDTGFPVRHQRGFIITEGTQENRDLLSGVPVF